MVKLILTWELVNNIIDLEGYLLIFMIHIEVKIRIVGVGGLD
jgi:hypothetical protein